MGSYSQKNREEDIRKNVLVYDKGTKRYVKVPRGQYLEKYGTSGGGI